MIRFPPQSTFDLTIQPMLQMVSEPNTRRCASEEAEPRMRWTRGGVPARTLGPEGGGSGVPHRLEEGMSTNEDAGPQRE